jgi:hypothetical protein
MLQDEKLQDLAFHGEEGTMVRGYDSESEVATYLEGANVKIAVS